MAAKRVTTKSQVKKVEDQLDVAIFSAFATRDVETKRYRIVTSVDQIPREYHEISFSRLKSWIILPRIMYFRGYEGREIPSYLEANMQNERGCHIFATHYNDLDYYIVTNGSFRMQSDPIGIHEVLPYYDSSGGFLHMARIVTPGKAVGGRQSGRFRHANNSGVDDVGMSRFTKQVSDKVFIRSRLEPRKECTAFYLRHATKLVYMDECATYPNQESRTYPPHNRALLLGGVFLLIEGVVAYVYASDLDAVYSRQELAKLDASFANLSRGNQNVLFLSPPHSQHQSLCYFVMQLGDDPNNQIKRNVIPDAEWLVLLPDNHRVDSILPLRQGLDEVYRLLNENNAPFIDYLVPHERYYDNPQYIVNCFKKNKTLLEAKRVRLTKESDRPMQKSTLKGSDQSLTRRSSSATSTRTPTATVTGGHYDTTSGQTPGPSRQKTRYTTDDHSQLAFSSPLPSQNVAVPHQLPSVSTNSLPTPIATTITTSAANLSSMADASYLSSFAAFSITSPMSTNTVPQSLTTHHLPAQSGGQPYQPYPPLIRASKTAQFNPFASISTMSAPRMSTGVDSTQSSPYAGHTPQEQQQIRLQTPHPFGTALRQPFQPSGPSPTLQSQRYPNPNQQYPPQYHSQAQQQPHYRPHLMPPHVNPPIRATTGQHVFQPQSPDSGVGMGWVRPPGTGR